MTRKKSNEPRCIHRHSIRTHPNCFQDNGMPKKRSVLRRELKRNLILSKLPKILIFDIETSPLKAFVWSTNVWNARVADSQILSEWFMLSWSAKWMFDDTVYSDVLTGSEARRENDSRIVKSIWKLLDEADVVVAHNGNKFDVPNLNTRFIVNNLPPTSPYQSIDTVLVARKQFGFTHNSLNALAKIFGFDVKLETNFELWKRCIEGDERALKRMEEYNRHDVELLEEVYIKIRPWIHSHPNLGLYIDSDVPVCSNCGSKSLDKTDKLYYTMAGKYELYRCECGAYVRVRTSSIKKEVRDRLVISVAR